jgi:hypothetical protein
MMDETNDEFERVLVVTCSCGKKLSLNGGVNPRRVFTAICPFCQKWQDYSPEWMTLDIPDGNTQFRADYYQPDFPSITVRDQL